MIQQNLFLPPEKVAKTTGHAAKEKGQKNTKNELMER